MNNIAHLVSSVNNIDIANEVSKATAQSIKKQWDEVYLFKEILSSGKNENKLSNIDNSHLKKALYIDYTKSNISLLEQLSNSNIQIYWPYSENWDGKSIPAVTYAPDNHAQEWNWAYKKIVLSDGSIQIDTIFVDEKYAETNPVWVINYSSSEYNGTLYNNVNGSFVEATSYIAHPWTMTEMQVTHQYDTWLNGGSEIQIQVITPTIPGYAGGVNIISFHVTRKDINNKKWISLNRYLNDDWREEEITNTMIILEKNSGRVITSTVSNSYINEHGLTVSCSNTYSYTDCDDLIHQMQYKRTTLLYSDPNKEWISSDGYVNFRMKMQ